MPDAVPCNLLFAVLQAPAYILTDGSMCGCLCSDIDTAREVRHAVIPASHPKPMTSDPIFAPVFMYPSFCMPNVIYEGCIEIVR